MASNPPRQAMSWGEVAGFALLAGVVAMLVLSGREPGRSLVAQGLPMPTLMAEGWLNADGPPNSDALKKGVVVVDCWATWCPPCRAAMPELARLYAQYEPLGVTFVGLTSEGMNDRQVIAQFINSVEGFDWPVGYGATPTFDMFAISALPTVIVFESGKVIWSSHQLNGIESTLDQAIANTGMATAN